MIIEPIVISEHEQVFELHGAAVHYRAEGDNETERDDCSCRHCDEMRERIEDAQAETKRRRATNPERLAAMAEDWR